MRNRVGRAKNTGNLTEGYHSNSMPFRTVRLVFVLALTLVAAGCTRLMRETFEYEEEITLAIDGSAVVTLSASEPALVALRGIALKTGPHVRPDRAALRAFFGGPGVVLRTPTFSRRYGRRFVHVTLEVADVRQLPRLAPFAWSTYRFAREGDALVFRQAVGAPSGKAVSGTGWLGNERVAFRMHIPSRVLWENATTDVERGNIVAWVQPLSQRLAGVPIDLEVRMEPQSILRNTLLLFVGTIAAAAATFIVVIWWVIRRGRRAVSVARAGQNPGVRTSPARAAPARASSADPRP